jgi:protein O-GlcNAc transferase
MSTQAPALPVAVDLSALLADLERALDLYRLDAQAAAGLRVAALAAAKALRQLPKSAIDHPELPRVQELARGIWSAGYIGLPVPPEDRDWAGAAVGSGWPGLLGAMLIAPAWQWPTALPALDAVPDWLWGHYVDWVFVPPCTANAIGAADLHLAKLEMMAEQLNTWTGRNLGARCVQAALEVFLRRAGETSPLRATRSIRRWSVARSGILAKHYHHAKDRNPAPVALPRDGRPLQIGVVLPEWGDSLAARSLLPRLTGLDPAMFTVLLFAERGRGDGFEKVCRTSFSKFQVLPQGVDARADMLYAANLDVLIFGGAMHFQNDLRLALQRSAPVQLVTDACLGVTGLPGIDLHLTALTAAAGEFAEAIAHVPGAAFLWDGETAAATFDAPSRADLGLPAEGRVLVSAPALEQLSPEVLHTWTEILAADPTSSLLLLLPAGSDTFALEQIFNRLQAATGLSSDRLVVSLGDPRAALSLGDVYLDTFPCSAPTPLLAAIAAGLPAVAWEGATHRARAGAQVLRDLGQQDWIATDAAGYVDRARRLIGDDSARDAARQSLQQSIEHRRGLGDAPLAGALFGAMLLRAYDWVAGGRRLPATLTLPKARATASELAEAAEQALLRQDGCAAVAAATEFLLVDQDSSNARSMLGRAYLLSGQADAAVACFFSALRGREQDAQAWLEVGAGLRARRESGPAINAYETALRLDATLIEGWIAIADLARSTGAHDLAEDAIGVARRIDSRDPRLAAY